MGKKRTICDLEGCHWVSTLASDYQICARGCGSAKRNGEVYPALPKSKQRSLRGIGCGWALEIDYVDHQKAATDLPGYWR